MGGLFKKKSSKTTQTTESHQEQENWLAKKIEPTVDAVIDESSNYELPDYEVAGLSQETKDQLALLTHGVNLNSYRQASEHLQNAGNTIVAENQQFAANARNVMSSLGQMTQSDYSKAIEEEINGAIQKNRISVLRDSIGEQTGTAVNALNRQAGGSGNMGNSRAGVAQGVIQGRAAQALSQGIVGIQTDEETQAAGRVQNYLNTRYNAASTSLQAANNQQQFGYSLYNQGQTYNSQYNAGYLQNVQNALLAQDQLRTAQQQQLDVNRMNQMQRMSPALNRLMYMNQGLSQVANYQTTGNSSGTTTTVMPSQGSSLGSSLLTMGGAAAGAMIGGPAGMQLGGMFGGMIGGAMSR